MSQVTDKPKDNSYSFTIRLSIAAPNVAEAVVGVMRELATTDFDKVHWEIDDGWTGFNGETGELLEDSGDDGIKAATWENYYKTINLQNASIVAKDLENSSDKADDA